MDSKSVSSDSFACSFNKICDGDIIACPWLMVFNRFSKSSKRLANILKV